MKNKEESIKKHVEDFLGFFKTGKFKSVYVDSFFLDPKLGVSSLEEACISLLILKHLYPKHIVFGEKERSSNQIDFGFGINEIIENFFIDKWLDYSSLKHQGFSVFSGAELNLRVFADELKSKRLKKTKPFNYLVQNLFNKLPTNLLNKDFDKFVR